MKKTVKRLTALITASVLTAFACVASLAYYLVTVTDPSPKSLSESYADTVIEVSNFDSLFLASKALAHNDSSVTGELTSDTRASRKTIRLTSDVTLNENLVITLDCHIDLNGHDLCLNGHSLTVSHGYEGSFLFSGNTSGGATGRVTVTTADDKIYIITPNADTHFDTRIPFVMLTTDAETGDVSESAEDAASHYTVCGFNRTYAAYDALFAVADALRPVTAPHVDRAVYSSVIASYGGTDNIAFDSSVFMPVVTSCSLCGDAAESACTVVWRDLDLPTGYYDYKNIRISYSSSDIGVVSDGGHVVIPAADTVVTLTVTVSAVEEDGTVTALASCPFTLHVPALQSDSSRFAAAKELLMRHLEPYYDNATEKYVFNRQYQLPLTFSGLGISFAYSEFEADGTVIPEQYYTYPNTSTEVICIEPTADSVTLAVTMTNTESSATQSFSLPMSSENAGLIITNASIASDIIESWYGGKININDIPGGYSTVDLHLTSDITTAERALGIKAVSYSIMNNISDVYEIYAYDSGEKYIERVQVKEGKNPADYIASVLLNIDFTFEGESVGTEDDEIQSLQIPINYTGSTALDPDNANSFIPYYNYYKRILEAVTAGYTVSDFAMPFCYGNGEPVLCYDLQGTAADAYDIYLYFGGNEYALDSSYENTSLAFDALLAEHGFTLHQIVLSGDAEWRFKIDKEAVPADNTTLGLVFYFKITTAATRWVAFADKDDVMVPVNFILAGLLRCRYGDASSTEAITSQYLYKWIYDNYNTYDTGSANKTYTIGTDRYTKYIIRDWLTQDATINYTDNSALFDNVTDYLGLRYLTGTRFVYFGGGLKTAAVAATFLHELPYMTSLVTLELSGCKLTDDGDTASWEALSALKHLANLDLDNNSINTFEFLSSLTSLRTVKCASNNTAGANGIFYGSSGLTNLYVFQELTDNGVLVYNTSNVPFSEFVACRDYSNLKGLQYQDKLPTGSDISEVYASFSTDPNDYSLFGNGDSSNILYTDTAGAAYNVTGRSLTFASPSADYFTLTYSITFQGGTNVSIVIKYPVTRY